MENADLSHTRTRMGRLSRATEAQKKGETAHRLLF